MGAPKSKVESNGNLTLLPPETSRPKCLGMTGSNIDGIQLVFDRPVSLDLEDPTSIGAAWQIPWKSLGEAILESVARHRKVRDA